MNPHHPGHPGHQGHPGHPSHPAAYPHHQSLSNSPHHPGPGNTHHGYTPGGGGGGPTTTPDLPSPHSPSHGAASDPGAPYTNLSGSQGMPSNGHHHGPTGGMIGEHSHHPGHPHPHHPGHPAYPPVNHNNNCTLKVSERQNRGSNSIRPQVIVWKVRLWVNGSSNERVNGLNRLHSRVCEFFRMARCRILATVKYDYMPTPCGHGEDFLRELDRAR